jgi:hypothetical protein
MAGRGLSSAAAPVDVHVQALRAGQDSRLSFRKLSPTTLRRTHVPLGPRLLTRAAIEAVAARRARSKMLAEQRPVVGR